MYIIGELESRVITGDFFFPFINLISAQNVRGRMENIISEFDKHNIYNIYTWCIKYPVLPVEDA